ncbi:MAG: hypothetical protein JST35_10475 [Armatimonadetes bacterium]|nr:hypothetical protein [Armatimonadota bacterium]
MRQNALLGAVAVALIAAGCTPKVQTTDIGKVGRVDPEALKTYAGKIKEFNAKVGAVLSEFGNKQEALKSMDVAGRRKALAELAGKAKASLDALAPELRSLPHPVDLNEFHLAYSDALTALTTGLGDISLGAANMDSDAALDTALNAITDSSEKNRQKIERALIVAGYDVNAWTQKTEFVPVAKPNP